MCADPVHLLDIPTETLRRSWIAGCTTSQGRPQRQSRHTNARNLRHCGESQPAQTGWSHFFERQLRLKQKTSCELGYPPQQDRGSELALILGRTASASPKAWIKIHTEQRSADAEAVAPLPERERSACPSSGSGSCAAHWSWSPPAWRPEVAGAVRCPGCDR